MTNHIVHTTRVVHFKWNWFARFDQWLAVGCNCGVNLGPSQMILKFWAWAKFFLCHMSVQNIILQAWAKFYMSHVRLEYYLVSMGQVLYVTCQFRILSFEHGPSFICHMSVQNIILWAWAKFYMSHVSSEYYLVSMGQVFYVTCQFRILSCKHGPSFICHMSVQNIILWAWAKFYMSHVSSEYYLVSMGQVFYVTCQFRILSCKHGPSFICHMSGQNIIL